MVVPLPVCRVSPVLLFVVASVLFSDGSERPAVGRYASTTLMTKWET